MSHKIIFVAEDSLGGRVLREALAKSRDPGPPATDRDAYYVTYPGGPLMGRRTEHIVVSRDLYARLVCPDTDPASQAAARWWLESVLCRLVPGGRVLTV